MLYTFNILASGALGFVAVWISFLWICYMFQTAPSSKHRESTLVLVTAHPDDEIMFFLPIIRAFGTKKLICLSSGDYDGLGKIRIKELEQVAEALGFSELIIGDFKDGPNHAWDAERIANFVEPYITDDDIIVTFDDKGISGHANHIATHYGLVKLKSRRPGLQVMELFSERNILVKYSGPIGAVMRILWKDGRQYFINVDPLLTYKMMALHESQFVWYRRLFVLTAQCTFVNMVQNI